jgi:hypothetical protein
MTPYAPLRTSPTMTAPLVRRTPSPTRRTTMSTAPPAGYPMKTWTGLDGVHASAGSTPPGRMPTPTALAAPRSSARRLNDRLCFPVGPQWLAGLRT